jgi:hypothetical protein
MAAKKSSVIIAFLVVAYFTQVYYGVQHYIEVKELRKQNQALDAEANQLTKQVAALNATRALCVEWANREVPGGFQTILDTLNVYCPPQKKCIFWKTGEKIPSEVPALPLPPTPQSSEPPPARAPTWRL